jgi:hypothetical protein
VRRQVRRPALWLAAVLTIVMASSASPQGNIDAGKTPAQMFADTCSNCHRRPQELKRASVGFLRQHYTPGAQEAAAMASYLAGVPADPRGGRDRGKATLEKDKARPHQQAQDRPHDRPKAQPAPKTKRGPEVAKSEAAEVPAEAPPEPVPEATPVPKLEPFEE